MQVIVWPRFHYKVGQTRRFTPSSTPAHSDSEAETWTVSSKSSSSTSAGNILLVLLFKKLLTRWNTSPPRSWTFSLNILFTASSKKCRLYSSASWTSFADPNSEQRLLWTAVSNLLRLGRREPSFPTVSSCRRCSIPSKSTSCPWALEARTSHTSRDRNMVMKIRSRLCNFTWSVRLSDRRFKPESESQHVDATGSGVLFASDFCKSEKSSIISFGCFKWTFSAPCGSFMWSSHRLTAPVTSGVIRSSIWSEMLEDSEPPSGEAGYCSHLRPSDSWQPDVWPPSPRPSVKPDWTNSVGAGSSNLVTVLTKDHERATVPQFNTVVASFPVPLTVKVFGYFRVHYCPLWILVLVCSPTLLRVIICQISGQELLQQELWCIKGTEIKGSSTCSMSPRDS